MIVMLGIIADKVQYALPDQITRDEARWVVGEYHHLPCFVPAESYLRLKVPVQNRSRSGQTGAIL